MAYDSNSRKGARRKIMKILKGTIVSVGMQNTVVVSIASKKVHPLYKKAVLRNRRHKADTNGLTVSLGDVVVMKETRPLSKEKHFALSSILEKADKVVLEDPVIVVEKKEKKKA